MEGLFCIPKLGEVQVLGSHNDTEDVDQKSSNSKSTVLSVAQLELKL